MAILTAWPFSMLVGCFTCGEDPDCKEYRRGECPLSTKACGHHCDCLWDQDRCCWCGFVYTDCPDHGVGYEGVHGLGCGHG